MNISTFASNITTFCAGTAAGLLASGTIGIATKVAGSRLLSYIPSFNTQASRCLNTANAVVVAHAISRLVENSGDFGEGFAFGGLLTTGVLGFLAAKEETFSKIETSNPGLTKTTVFTNTHKQQLYKKAIDCLVFTSAYLLRNTNHHAPMAQVLSASIGMMYGAIPAKISEVVAAETEFNASTGALV